MTEEEKINIKEQFNYIVKNGIAPILKSAGFRKKGNNLRIRLVYQYTKRRVGI